MNCPKCSANVSEDALFCSSCGYSMAEEKERQNYETDTYDMANTMVIPVVKPSDIQDKVSNTEPVKKAEKAPVRNGKTAKEISSPDKKNGVLVFCIVFLITLVVGLSAVLAFVLLSGNSDTPDVSTDNPPPVSGEVSLPEVNTPDEPEVTVPDEGESEGVEEKPVIQIDTSFEFTKEVTFEDVVFTFKTLSSSEYGYECAIPSEFVFVSENSGEIRYKAEDNTAYMDIGATTNNDSLDCASVKNMICSKLGVSADVYDEADGYFVLRCIREDTVYYYKCFVDDHIRYMEFVYPNEYRDMYEGYASDMSNSFIKTN